MIGIRTMREVDRPRVRAIYQEGIATGDVTFETEVPEREAWDRSHLESCRLVALEGPLGENAANARSYAAEAALGRSWAGVSSRP